MCINVINSYLTSGIAWIATQNKKRFARNDSQPCNDRRGNVMDRHAEQTTPSLRAASVAKWRGNRDDGGGCTITMVQ